ncbi:hypothetical protein CXK92_14230 [Stutzerimonas stutzeri]|uniref:Uncharacterized protein n=1 Tax=Stutzerimonas stutzeri TaxID=316 RepID=A0A2N8RZL1_STUST|nr:hypothetical protein CXK92_14230 [Stutzerimonas stutzeri]
MWVPSWAIRSGSAGIIRFVFTAASATAMPSEIIQLQLHLTRVKRASQAMKMDFCHPMQPSLQRLSIEDKLSQGPRYLVRSVKVAAQFCLCAFSRRYGLNGVAVGRL